MVISHNLLAMNAQRQFNITGTKKKKSTEKLASGYKINRAADDAAGLAISEKMRRQIRGLDQGARNTQDGISLLQVADGALSEVHDMLHRMNELAIQAANGTNSDSDREAIQQEVDQIKREIDRIGSTIKFNERYLFYDGKRINDSRYEEEAKLNLMTIDEAKEQLRNGPVKFDSDIYGLDGNLLLTEEAANLIVSSMNIYCDVEEFESSNYSSKVDGAYGPARTATYNIAKKYINLLADAGEIAGVDLKAECDTAYKNLEIFLSRKYQPHNFLEYGCGDQVRKIYNKLNSVDNMLAKYTTPALTFICDTGNHYVRDSNMALYSAIEAISTNELTKSDSLNVSDIEDILPVVNLYRVDPTAQDRLADFYRYISAYAEASDVVDDESRSIWIQCGPEKENGISISLEKMNTRSLGINRVSTLDRGKSAKAIINIKKAIQKVSEARSKLGAQQNRLEHTYKNVTIISENTQVAESRIRDTDMAKEMVELSKHNVLEQVGTSIIAQANQSNQGVLSLL